MDNHPIPQDITGFQFKLIGKMTIRQFVYVAIGGVIAWLMFFILEPPALIKWPVSVISLGLGVMIAFVPIDGRPMDTMIRNFINALLSPTQFIYQKGGSTTPEENLQAATNPPVATAPTPTQVAPATIPAPSMPQPAQTPPPAPAKPAEAQTQATPTPVAPQTPPPVNFPDPTAVPSSFVKNLNEQQKTKREEPQNKPINESEELKKQIEELKKQLDEKSAQNVPTQPQTQPTPTPAPAQPTSPDDQKNLEQMLAESVRQKEALEKQIIEMQTKQAGANKQKFTPVTATQQQTTQRVRRVPADMARSVGIPDVPDAPNLITGIVKDSRGNPIPNILVEVKDPDSNPVRAFKTNKLGKFASATPLSNGKYVISFEDPGEKHRFDDIEMELVGSNVMPLEVISVDPREELRRELFN